MSKDFKAVGKTSYKSKLKQGLLRKAKELKGKTFRQTDPKYGIGEKWKFNREAIGDPLEIIKSVADYGGAAKKAYESGVITNKEYIGALKSQKSQMDQIKKREDARTAYDERRKVSEMSIDTSTSIPDADALRKYGKYNPKLDKHTLGTFQMDMDKHVRPTVSYRDKKVKPSTMLHELDHMKDYAQKTFVPRSSETKFWKSRQLPTDTIQEGAKSPKGIGHHSWKTGQSEMAQEKHIKTGGSALNYMNIPKVIKGSHERYNEGRYKYLKELKKPQYQTKQGKKLKESKVDTRVMKSDVKDLVDIQGKKEPWEKVPYHKMSDIRVKGIKYKEDPKPIKKSLKRLYLM